MKSPETLGLLRPAAYSSFPDLEERAQALPYCVDLVRLPSLLVLGAPVCEMGVRVPAFMLTHR